MKEYVLTIAVRDPDHPLVPTVVHECGVDVRHPEALADALSAMAGLIRALGTPEKVAEYMRKNAVVTEFKKAVSK